MAKRWREKFNGRAPLHEARWAGIKIARPASSAGSGINCVRPGIKRAQPRINAGTAWQPDNMLARPDNNRALPGIKYVMPDIKRAQLRIKRG